MRALGCLFLFALIGCAGDRSPGLRGGSAGAGGGEISTSGPVAEAATRLEEAADTLKETSRRYARTTESSFRHLDLPWYARSATVLERNGCVGLGDIADLDHNEKNPQARTLIRVMRCADGQTMAGLFHYWDTRPQLQGLPINDIRVVELETELSDGSFVVTTNAPRQVDLDMGPMIDKVFVFTKDLDVHSSLHADHLVEYLRKNPSLHVRSIATLDDVIAAQQRMQMVKGTYRQEMEIPFTEDELNHVTDNRFQAVVRMVSDELRRRFPSWW